MSESNQSFIEKADTQVSDLTSGGLLAVEQAQKFYEIMIEQSKLLQIVTTVPMTTPSYEIPKAGFTGEILRPGTEGQALGEADRAKPVFDKATLTPKEFVAEARLSYTALEDNIERGTFWNTIQNLLAKAVARDLEKVIIRGDVLSASLLLAQLDGVLKQATSHVYDAGGARFTKSIGEAMARLMPSQFWEGNDKMAFLTSKNACIDLNASYADRPTALGDSFLVKKSSGQLIGLPVIDIPLFPENLGAGTNKTCALLLDPTNINVGVNRQIRVETDKDISAREYIVVVTVRFDVKYGHEPAVVQATNILAS